MPRITLDEARPDTPSRLHRTPVDGNGGDDSGPDSIEPVSIPVVELDSSELESVRGPDLPGRAYRDFTTTSAQSGAIAGPMGAPEPPALPKK